MNALVSIYQLTVFRLDSIMSLFLNVLDDVNGADYRKLSVEAMECAGLIGSYFVVFMICGLLMSTGSYFRWSRGLPSGRRYKVNFSSFVL
jgi:hypothetical protein